MNRHSLFLAILLAVLTGALLPSCSHEKKYRIGISQCSSDDWRSKMNDEVMREAMLHEDVEVEIRSGMDKNQKQIEDIRYFADNGFDIILAAPNEAEAITPVIREVYKKGIPVVVFDRDITDDSYTAHIATDNVRIGRDAARYAIAHSRHGGDAGQIRAIELLGLKGSTPARDRHEGFSKELLAGGGVIVGSGHADWNQSDAVRVADSLLRLHPEANLIYAHNDRMAIGASEVARRLGRKIYIIGIDGAPEIGIRAVADSVIDATFIYPTEGHRLLQTALAIVKGEPFERETSLPLSSAVDISNADILLNQNSSLQVETEKMKALKARVDNYLEKYSTQTLLLYALLAVVVLLIVITFLIIRSYWQHRRHQAILLEQNRKLEEQGQEQKCLNAALQEAVNSKLAFYTNASHDLRTPLTLIEEPVHQLAEASNLTSDQRVLARLADKNVRILHRLINQILDFRKFETGKLHLNLQEIDFNAAAREWVASFDDLAHRRDIHLSLQAPSTPVTLACDPEKMERVFFNILSNAIKYTPDNGRVNVEYAVEGENLVIRFSDNGIGIADSDIGSIFDRFYQVEKVRPNGSGIGLSLVKAFVELHGGTIEVQSKIGKGSTFTVTIPVRHIHEEAVTPEPAILSENVRSELQRIDKESVMKPDAASTSETAALDGERPMVLVIDDNEDVRVLIEQLLSSRYDIHHAADGREGLAKATRLTPDLIICDIMMPIMDGLELCRRVKEEVSTSHIPVLLLTACARDIERADGYNSGADGYLSKPFSAEVLRARCRSLLENRKRIADVWKAVTGAPSAGGNPMAGGNFLAGGISAGGNQPQGAAPVLAAGATVGNVDPDDCFYTRFLEVFSEHISNPNLSIEEIASEMGLGHSQFYRKIKALTNYTPVELIRQLRLKRARHLLLTTRKTVSEIAYEVGFSSPAYFTKCYRTAFNETPTSLRENLS